MLDNRGRPFKNLSWKGKIPWSYPKIWFVGINLCQYKIEPLPWQWIPSDANEYPIGQIQAKDPGILTHLNAQLFNGPLHSFISEMINKYWTFIAVIKITIWLYCYSKKVYIRTRNITCLKKVHIKKDTIKNIFRLTFGKNSLQNAIIGTVDVDWLL